MVDTQDIEKAAKDLGAMIADHEAAKKMQEASKQFDADQDTQRLLNDYQREAEKVARKQQNNEPIEVAEKRRLQELQDQVIANPLVSKLQIAQMDYLDLMRRVQQIIFEQASGEEAAGPTAPGPNLQTPTNPLS